MQFKKKVKQLLQQFRLTDTKKDRAILMTCIGIAFVFWILVKLSQSYTSECEILLNYQLPEDKILQEMPPKKITATIKGSGWDLLKEYGKSTDRNMSVNFNEKRTYLNTSELVGDVTQVLNNKDLQVQQLSPNFILVNLDEKVFKKVAIRLVDSSTIADQHFLKDSIRLLEDSVLVSGPESIINDIDDWETIQLKLKNIKESATIVLMLKEPKNKQIELNPTQVNASIEVEKYTEKKFFIPVLVKNATDSIKIFPKQIQLSVTVGVSAYDTLDAEDFVAEIDMNKAISGSNNIPISITRKATAAKGIHFSPKAVEYFILKEKEKEF